MTAPHVTGRLAAHALGALTPREQGRVTLHLQRCTRCTRELAQVRDNLAQLAVGLPEAHAPALLRDGLSQAIGEVSRFADFIEPLGRRLHASRSRVEALLDGLDDGEAWTPTRAPGLQVRIVDATARFIRVAPGHTVPPVWRRTTTRLFVLQGGLVDAAGQMLGPGSTWTDRALERPHAMQSGPDLICLALRARQRRVA